MSAMFARGIACSLAYGDDFTDPIAPTTRAYDAKNHIATKRLGA